MTQQNAQFVKALTDCQSRIYAFALSMLADPEAAADVLQETNLVLWQKVDEFDQIDNYPAYALKVAQNQVRNLRRKMQRDRLMFDDDVIEKLAAEADAYEAATTPRLIALQECMEKLPRHHRELIHKRYMQNTSVTVLAQAINKTANAVAVMLFRARESLVECIESRVDELEGRS